MIMAGIVTFNPDISKLNANVDAILPQVDKLLVVDNGSTNIKEVLKCMDHREKIHIIKNSKNYGIAKALNQILEYVNLCEGEWVLTLDQDSLCYSDIISTLSAYIDRNVGMISPLIEDCNVGHVKVEQLRGNEIESCITSGCLTNVGACLSLGGFDEKMFIDLVDIEMCYRLRCNGYSILQANKVCMEHEIGSNGRTINILGKKVYLFNHSSFREYYCARNTIYVARKYKENKKRYLRGILTAINRTFIIFAFESNKFDKLSKRIKGIWDGFHMPV